MTDTYELPPIPMAATDWHGSDVELMLEYARLAVKAERERCAALAECWSDGDNVATEIVAAIRKG